MTSFAAELATASVTDERTYVTLPRLIYKDSSHNISRYVLCTWPIGRIACAENFGDFYLRFRGILNLFCCMTLLAVE